MITSDHNERCRDCKESINNLLAAIFDDIEINYGINLPVRLDGYLYTGVYEYLIPIYQALQNYRGRYIFVNAKSLPRVDYFIPKHKLIIEFDESQHFIKPKEITLGFYPHTEEFGFSVNRWRKLCQKINKHDNHPPYRDEQRAWYDTLRDFAPFLWRKSRISLRFRLNNKHGENPPDTQKHVSSGCGSGKQPFPGPCGHLKEKEDGHPPWGPNCGPIGYTV